MKNLTLSGLDPAHFESNIEGRQTHLYTMRNSKGMEVCITNFGARIVSIMVPDRKGVMHDVVLGYDNIAQYADRINFGSDFGAAIGRYANRINKGQITVDGKTIQLPQTTMATVCTADPRVGNIRCMTDDSLTTLPCR